jgi:copper chaperone CopZ
MTLFFLAMTLTGYSQSKVADTLSVSGVCDMCKKRIETALDVSGVWVAEYNPQTEKLFVVYKRKKITLEEISKLLNDVGHDTELSKAPDEIYENIHGCCRYRDAAVVESH